MKKFVMTDSFIEVFGKKLFQVKALVAFGCVKEGELGGYIEEEKNLSQSGNAWVYGNAEVYGNARVSGDAEVMWISKIGSRLGTTTIFRTKVGVSVSCGCFFGTLEEFSESVEKSHGDNDHGKQYKLLIEMAKIKFGV